MNGLVYPLVIANGSISTTDYFPKLVAGAIVSSLKTRTEERVFRPDYGRYDEEFNSINSLTDVLSRTRQAVEFGLEGYEGVEFEVRGRLADDGLVNVQVVYTCPESLTNTIEITV